MSQYLTLSYLVAFLLGVALSAMVKGWVSSARGKLGA
jgi:hypothetical protein